MMIIARFFIILLFLINVASARTLNPDLTEEIESIPLTTDSRIKTYVYNSNEVYLLLLHYGFQSHIEFEQGEEIKNLALGDTYAWKLTPLGNRLFVKPLEKNIHTNMTVITNRRTYQFDLVASEFNPGEEEDLVYLIRFFYPKLRGRGVK